MSITKIDDPAVKRIELSRSDKPTFRIKRDEYPFNDHARLVISRKKTPETVLQTLSLGNGIEKEDQFLKFVIDATIFRQKKVYAEFDGYGKGNRHVIFEIIINNSAL